jgi:hypothetical protein
MMGEGHDSADEMPPGSIPREPVDQLLVAQVDAVEDSDCEESPALRFEFRQF